MELYCFLIRPVLECAVLVWASLSSYLSAKIESIQQRALKKTFRSGFCCYNNCLEKVNLLPLHQKIEKICHEFIKKNKNRPKIIEYHGYNMRSGITNYSTSKISSERMSHLVGNLNSWFLNIVHTLCFAFVVIIYFLQFSSFCKRKQ